MSQIGCCFAADGCKHNLTYTETLCLCYEQVPEYLAINMRHVYTAKRRLRTSLGRCWRSL